MSLLQAFGMTPWNYQSGQVPSWEHQQAMAQSLQGQMAYMRASHTCIHIDCPKCKEENMRQIIAQKKIDWEKARKKEDYEKRCKQYMKRFKKGI